MAFHATGLPSIAAATADLLPSIANTILVPWRGSNSSLKAQSATAAPASRAQEAREPPPPPPIAEKLVTPPELPEFLRVQFSDMELSYAASLPTILPATIHASIAGMSRRSLSTANSLLRGPAVRTFTSASRTMNPSASVFKALQAAPAVTPTALAPTRRFFGYPAFRATPTTPPIKTFSGQQQRRGFGTGGISRSLLANREASANSNPNSATAQNAFYQVLLKANMPAIVVERYQSGHFASNEAADEAYSRALAMINGSTTGSTSSVIANTGLTEMQLQAVGQAVAAQTHGGRVAIAKGQQGTGTKDGPIHVVVDESLGGVVFRWVKFGLWFGFFTYLSFVVVTMVIEGLNTIKRPTARQDSEAKAQNQTARFTDVHGCDEAKEELQELVEFLRNPEKFNTLGGKLPKGVLLVGPPGTGKTLLARAVAGEAGVPFFYMSGSEFDEVYVGVGAKRVRDLFAAAKAKSPSIVFIDELDAIGGRRNARDQAYAKQTLNQLLTELDGFEQNSGVIIIGATNFPKLLDKALTRPGRFDRHIIVPLPDVKGRIDILKHHAKKVKTAPDVNLETIAAICSGLSGADLESIVNQAAVHATKAKQNAVTTKDFDWARDKVIMGAERRTMVISPKEKEMTAYHEAGHALIMFFAGKEDKVHKAYNELYKVTILPRGQSLGHTSYLPADMGIHSFKALDFLTQIEVSFGGKVAEEMVYGSDMVSSGCAADLESATRMAWQMVAQLGMSERLGPVEYLNRYQHLSSETRAMVEEEVKRTLSDAYVRARKLLVAKRKELDLLAKALVEYETLDKAEVEKVIRGEKLTDRIAVPPGPMSVPIPEPLDAAIPGIAPLPNGEPGAKPPPPTPGGLVGAPGNPSP